MPNDHRLELLAKIPPDAVRWMLRVQPSHRAMCRSQQRPCPHLLCKFHTYFRTPEETSLPHDDDNDTPPESQLALQQPETEFWQQPTCRLDQLEQEAQERGEPIETDQPVGPHPFLQDTLQILTPPKPRS